MNETGPSKETVVVFAPHPDDETIGCGGTIARKLAEGYEVVVVVLTSGENLLSVLLDIHTDPSPEEVGRLRREETRRATEILGVKKENLLFWDYEDGGLERAKDDATERIVELLRELAPGAVFCHNPYEAHRDHRAANRIVRNACARLPNKITRYQYFVSPEPGFSIESLDEQIEKVDISAYLPRKEKALAQFQSHLGVLSDRQPGPLTPNFDTYLTPDELFIIDD